jgi:GNAT superfamily N-acetyltransferase
MQADITIRPLSSTDIQAVMEIQSACYPSPLHEEASHLLCKHAQSPTSCWVATQGQTVMAYLLTHPWSGDLPPSLNSPLASPLQDCDIYFIHDLAVHPKAQGLGLARLLINTALSWGRQQKLSTLRLIAVAGAADFWLKQGLTPVRGSSEALRLKLSSYGPDTHYLEASI